MKQCVWTKTTAYAHPVFSLTYTHTHITEQTQLYWALLPARIKKEVSSAAGQGGQPEQAVWAWVRTKLLASDQSSDRLKDEPGALGVMYSMPSVRGQVLQPGNRRGSLGFPRRVSQPAALRGILEGTVLGCDTTLADALCRLQNSKICIFLLPSINHLYLFRWVGE